MGLEKGGTKSSGFFHLFDWNKKSRKKLFTNGTASAEGPKQGNGSNENLPSAKHRLVDDDEVVGAPSAKGSTPSYSCASSVTDEEGNGVKAPGVVARLMGLDSMPTSGVSEPYSTPFFDRRSLRDNRSHNRSPEFCINDNFNHGLHRGDSYSKKLMEFRSQKMPSSPIERFQSEILPPRSAKSLSLTHHKLLSPIKNPGFVSSRNAADIMEAAAKILDPGFQPSSKGKVSSFRSSSISLKIRDSKEILAASQRASRILDSARTPIESTDFRYLRGQPLNRSWNGSEITTPLRRSSESEGSSMSSAKDKGKSISLALQAKKNVQRREGLNTVSRSTLDQKEHEEHRLNQLFKSQPSNQKNKTQKKPSAANASGVLRQNNQKQNCPSNKGKLASKQSISNQQGRKVVSGDPFSGKNKTSNKLPGNSRISYRKDGLEICNLDNERLSSSNRDFPQKKRLIERGFHSDKTEFTDNNLFDRHEKHVQPNFVIGEHTRRTEDDRRSAMDVISFTFTSPLIKPVHGSGSPTKVVYKSDRRNIYSFSSNGENGTSDSTISSLGLNVISGDSLSLLLEQKLKELTTGFELSNCDFDKSGSFSASAPFLQESESTSYSDSTARVEHEKDFLRGHYKNGPESIFGYGVSSDNSVFGLNHKLQGVEEVECSSSSFNARNEPDLLNPSPLSILEAPFSNESHNSSESSGCTDVGKLCSSSVQAQNKAGSNHPSTTLLVETEIELLDSASSSLSEMLDGNHASEYWESNTKKDMDYVKQVLGEAGLMAKYMGSYYFTKSVEALDPLLFEKMESKIIGASRGEDEDGKSKRKVMFHCMNECLESRKRRFFSAGYRSWAKGVAVLGKDLVEELYGEISGWKSMGDWMVDELVDKDMSGNLGGWVNFEIEAFEAGVEIEEQVLDSMVDEVVRDFLTKAPYTCTRAF